MVWPSKVEVVAPREVRQREIDAFVTATRPWVREKARQMQASGISPLPRRFVSGSRILFRGRKLELRVKRARIAEPDLRYRSAFHVRVPRHLGPISRERAARSIVIQWLQERAREDALALARPYVERLGVRPKVIRVKDAKTIWGSCAEDGSISLNWRLVTAPRPVFEYIVVHELCHLVEHNHGERFWRLVGKLMPDYEEHREWLQRGDVGIE